jgi:hypothetical protein
MSVLSPEVAELRELRDRRNAKLVPLVKDFKPAWLIDVSVTMFKLELVFDLIFRPYAGRGWIKRRYRYDGESDVLHFIGEVEFPESELSKLPQESLVK